jgi:hypothetical protein
MTEEKNCTGQQKHARNMNVLKETEGLAQSLAVVQSVLHDGCCAVPIGKRRAAGMPCCQ